MASIEERVENLIKPKIEELGYYLYDVQYIKEGTSYFLRVFIEKENGNIDLNDCENVNNGITDILDTADYIKEQYFLEVSSTGVEKLLRKQKHLETNIGNKIEVKLFKPVIVNKLQENDCTKKNKKEKDKNKKEVIGILKSFDDNELIIELEDKTQVNIDRKNISVIKTFFDWDSI